MKLMKVLIFCSCCFAATEWEPLGPYQAMCQVLCTVPSDNDIVYAASFDGAWRHRFYKSTDGGSSWNYVGELTDMTYWVTSLEIDPTDTDILYASVNPQFVSYPYVYKSTDGGVTWNGLPAPESCSTVWDMIVHNSSPSIVFAVGQVRSNGKYLGAFFKSTDSGTTWAETILDSGEWGRAYCITLDHADPNILYLGGEHVHDGLPQHGTIYKSINCGASFTEKSSGLIESAVNDIAVHEVNSNIVYAATYNGVYKSTDSSGSWVEVYSSPNIRCLATSVDDPAVVYALEIAGLASPSVNISSTGTLHDGHYADIVCKSTDEGESWAETGSGIHGSAGAEASYDMSARNDDADVVYLTTYTGFYKTTNGGTSWFESNSGMDWPAGVSALAISPSDPSVIYFGGFDVFTYHKSINSGTDWTRPDVNLLNIFGQLTAHNTNPDIVLGANCLS